MSDYQLTRDAAGKITTRYSEMLQQMEDDFEDEVLVQALVKYYDARSEPNKIDNSDDVIEPDEDLLWAIDRLLQEFMTHKEYGLWANRKPYRKE